MNANDIILINTIVGAVVIPPLVTFLKSAHWSDSLKRSLALAICLILSVGEYFAVGNHFESFALSVPVLFGMATAAYTLFFKDKLGSLEDVEPLQGIVDAINPPKP